MTASASQARGELLNRGLLLEYVTVGWNIVEGIIAVGAGMLAGSPALIGFGADSFIESISGSVLIWRLAGEPVWPSTPCSACGGRIRWRAS